MNLQTLVLTDQTEAMTVGNLIQQAAKGGLEIRRADGEVVGYFLSPKDEESWAYAEARVYFENHRDEFEAARARRTGVTTAELLAKARAVTDSAAAP